MKPRFQIRILGNTVFECDDHDTAVNIGVDCYDVFTVVTLENDKPKMFEHYESTETNIEDSAETESC